MHVAVIEYARHCAGLEGADSTEFNPATPYPVIALVTEWIGKDGAIERRDEESDLGGTMRLGAQEVRLRRESWMRAVYGADIISERHRHRYEFNNTYMDPLQDAGLRIAGKTLDGTLVEVVEVPDHPWFIACQFHPEFTSTPRDGHPLFRRFVEAANDYRERAGGNVGERVGASAGGSAGGNVGEGSTGRDAGEVAGERGVGGSAGRDIGNDAGESARVAEGAAVA